uniref:Uncharacterized protein n=1 Tax=Ananas comosus var. bracteatus TaxID=296719 RepID=A0A6V7QTD0_ANACO
MDPLQGGEGSSSSKKKHSDATLTEHDEKEQPIIRDDSSVEKETPQSCSSSSDDSSEEDLFQFDIPLVSNPAPDSANPHLASNSANAVASLIDDDMICLGHQLEHDELSELGPKQSPAIQVMNTASDVPDPNRIPSSVFARTKSATPMEWSVASNESLFSIHAGNSSFSRDHVFLSGKSEELLSNYSSGSPLDMSAPVPPKSDASPLTTNAATVAESGGNAAAKDVLNDSTEGSQIRIGVRSRRHLRLRLLVCRVAPVAARRAFAPLLFQSSQKPQMSQLNKVVEAKIRTISVFSKNSTLLEQYFSSLHGFVKLTGEGRSGSIKVEPELPVSTNSEQPQQQPATAAPSQAETPKVGPLQLLLLLHLLLQLRTDGFLAVLAALSAADS